MDTRTAQLDVWWAGVRRGRSVKGRKVESFILGVGRRTWRIDDSSTSDRGNWGYIVARMEDAVRIALLF